MYSFVCQVLFLLFSTSFDIYFLVRCHSIFSTASVFYHTVFCLSRSFLKISNYLFYLNFRNNSFIYFVSNSFVSITPLFLFVNYFFLKLFQKSVAVQTSSVRTATTIPLLSKISKATINLLQLVYQILIVANPAPIILHFPNFLLLRL